MILNNYQGLFEDWELKHARGLIKQVKRQFRLLDRESEDDLLQDCLTHWYFKRDQFDPEKMVNRRTFMRSVVENKVMDIVRFNQASHRKTIHDSIPIDNLIVDDEDALSDSLLTTDKEIELFIRSELKGVLARAMTKLSRRQKEMCKLIQDEGLNIKQVSEKMNIPRTTIRDEVRRIQEVFREEGLNDYL